MLDKYSITEFYFQYIETIFHYIYCARINYFSHHVEYIILLFLSSVFALKISFNIFILLTLISILASVWKNLLFLMFWWLIMMNLVMGLLLCILLGIHWNCVLVPSIQFWEITCHYLFEFSSSPFCLPLLLKFQLHVLDSVSVP